MNGKVSLKGAGGRCPLPGQPAAGAGGGRCLALGHKRRVREVSDTFLCPFNPLSPWRDRFPTHRALSEPDTQGMQGRMCVINKVN